MDTVRNKLLEARTEANTLINEAMRKLPAPENEKRGSEFQRLKKLTICVESIDNALITLAGY